MATRIVMPSFGMYTAEGTVAHWLRPEGTHVERGDPILEIETDKALNEIIAPSSGTLYHVAKVGMLVKEEGLLGYILAQGESIPDGAEPAGTATTGVSSSSATGEASVSFVAREGPVKASPLARNLAKEHGIDLATLQGSGPGGRIVEADVVARIDEVKQKSTASSQGATKGKRVALTTMRRSIGEKLRRSINTAIPLTLTREVEADQLVVARGRFSEKAGAPVPYDAYFMKFLALSLREFPGLNVVVDADAVIQSDDTHIGFAVALPEGLVVPVVRDVDTKPLATIAEEIRSLTDRARSNKLHAEDLAGGSSTVTNLGGYDVDAFTPILNPPQSTILGVGRILQRAVVKSGVLTAANTCWLSFTFDHRVTDGGPAAQALDAIERMMNDAKYLFTLNES